jgi:hypothetical protein
MKGTGPRFILAAISGAALSILAASGAKAGDEAPAGSPALMGGEKDILGSEASSDAVVLHVHGPDGVQEVEVALPGEIRQFEIHGHHLYVARGWAGLTIVDVTDPLSPTEVATFLEGHEVSGFAVTGSTVIAIVTSLDLVPIDVSDPSRPRLASASQLIGKGLQGPDVDVPTGKAVAAEEPAEAIEAKEAIRGSVTKIETEWVFIDVGSSDGVEVGMAFEVLSQKPVKKPDPETGGMVEVPSNEVTAVVVIESVSTGDAAGRLDRGEVARVGDTVVQTGEAPRTSLAFPPNTPGLSQLVFMLRPFFNVESDRLAFGMLDEMRLGHLFEVPFRLEVALSPLGTGFAGDVATPIGISGLATYCPGFFEIGLGIGGNVSRFTHNSGFTINQVMRLGSLDGLHMRAEVSFTIVKRGGDRYKFIFGMGQGTFNIPVHRKVTLVIEGGAGTNGWFFTTIGTKLYFRGSGGPGTIAVPVALGYGRIFDHRCHEDDHWEWTCEGLEMGGPIFSIGIDARF